jgi:hypothetical protein
MAQPAAANQPASEWLDPHGALVERLCFLIRQSAIIQEARVDAFLDGIELAAEQVQEVRISMLEQPKEVTGWDILGAAMVEFVMESNLPGKLLKAAAKGIFSASLRRAALYAALPRGPQARELVEEARRVAERLGRMNAGRFASPWRPAGSVQGAIRGNQAAARATALEGALVTAKGKSPKDQRDIYHGIVESLAREAEAEQNYAAVGKAVREALGRARVPSRALLGDTAGVSVRTAARDYAMRTRLALRTVHARVESEVRANWVSPDGVGLIADAFSVGDLKLDEGNSGVEASLADVRNGFLILFEAVIWARLYGFDPVAKTPLRVSNQGLYKGVEEKISEYWFKRFGPTVEAWKKERGATVVPFATDAPANQAIYLQQYFWAVVGSLPKLGPGQMTAKAI